MCVRIYVCMYIYTYVHMYVHVCMCVCIYSCNYMCVNYVCIYVYMYIMYLHICMCVASFTFSYMNTVARSLTDTYICTTVKSVQCVRESVDKCVKCQTCPWYNIYITLLVDVYSTACSYPCITML